MDVVTALLGQSMGWRKLQIVGWVLIFLGAAMLTIPFIFYGIGLESWRELFENLYVPVMSLTIGISVNVLTPIYHRRITHFREVLDNPTAGLHHAAIQPCQDYEAMSLPVTIELAGRRQVALGWVLASYAGTLLAFLLWQRIADILAVSEPFLLMVAFTTLLFAVIAAILVAQPRHEEIRITEEGLTVRTNESHTIQVGRCPHLCHRWGLATAELYDNLCTILWKIRRSLVVPAAHALVFVDRAHHLG